MKLIKTLKKSEKGSVTLMVLTTMIFVLVILMAYYFSAVNKSGNQDREILQIEKQYLTSDNDINQEYIDTLNSLTKLSMEQAQSNGMFEKTTNTEVTDDYGNKIVVPAGFKITEDTTKVAEGIIVEDKAGNQFVWIPVGTGENAIKKSNSTVVEIELNRYTFAENGTQTAQETNTIDIYYQELSSSTYENTVAKDIEAFKTSANNNHGYYIGRYEARKSLEGNLTVVGSDRVYNDISQQNAATASRNMYTSNMFTSDLINSYAWDTAIVFEQAFDNRTTDKTTLYSRQNSLNTSLETTGTNNLTDKTKQDNICNIWDMASNYYEWTTETSNDQRQFYCGPSTCRGNPTSSRGNTSGVYGYNQYSFRPILYLNN